MNPLDLTWTNEKPSKHLPSPHFRLQFQSPHGAERQRARDQARQEECWTDREKKAAKQAARLHTSAGRKRDTISRLEEKGWLERREWWEECERQHTKAGQESPPQVRRRKNYGTLPPETKYVQQPAVFPREIDMATTFGWDTELKPRKRGSKRDRGGHDQTRPLNIGDSVEKRAGERPSTHPYGQPEGYFPPSASEERLRQRCAEAGLVETKRPHRSTSTKRKTQSDRQSKTQPPPYLGGRQASVRGQPRKSNDEYKARDVPQMWEQGKPRKSNDEYRATSEATRGASMERSRPYGRTQAPRLPPIPATSEFQMPEVIENRDVLGQMETTHPLRWKWIHRRGTSVRSVDEELGLGR